jgi:Bromodomain/PHD-finger
MRVDLGIPANDHCMAMDQCIMTADDVLKEDDHPPVTSSESESPPKQESCIASETLVANDDGHQDVSVQADNDDLIEYGNRALLDPNRFGWSAAGTILDVMSPHERVRRPDANTTLSTDPIVGSSTTNGSTVSTEVVTRPGPGRKRKVPRRKYESGDSPNSCLVRDTHGWRFPALIQGSRKRPWQFQAGVAREEAMTVYVDTLAYHGGRAGYECQLRSGPATDTHQYLGTPFAPGTARRRPRHDGASLLAPVVVEVPLMDDDDDDEKSSYRQVVNWDLQNPATPTPEVFCTRLAEQFGLSLEQTWQLTESIQNQLASFVTEHFSQVPAWALRNVATGEPVVREQDATTTTTRVLRRYAPVLYGQVTSMTKAAGTLECVPVSCRPQPAAATDNGESKASTRSNRVVWTASNVYDVSAVVIEPEYEQEVRARLRKTGEQAFLAAAAGTVGELTLAKNIGCHACANKRDWIAIFACGHPAHTFCSTHLARYGCVSEPAAAGESIQDEGAWKRRFNSPDSVDPWTMTHCPICTLGCSCVRCSRKLKVICAEFKHQTLEQGCAPEATVFDNLMQMARSTVIKRQTLSDAPTLRLKKAPGIDAAATTDAPTSRRSSPNQRSEAKPTTPTAAATNYKVPIQLLPDDEVAEPARSNSESRPVEDGSVDFCIVCGKHGNILCCDYCPRAFHRLCVVAPDDGGDESSKEPWQCPRCRAEQVPSVDHVLTGEKSLDLVALLFDSQARQVSPVDYEYLELLSILHEMMCHLMQYEFGYMFKEPVDLARCPEYTTLVKSPKDLGTIAKDLVNGVYTLACRAGNPDAWDECIAKILCDVELVWHNCFLFNVEGSSVYRMAQVQRVRAENIRRASFEHLLTDRIRQAVESFVRKCEQDRINIIPGKGASTEMHAGSRRRCVGVVDPETLCIVKIYSSLRGAANAIVALRKMGHGREMEGKWDGSNISMRKITAQCKEDRSKLFFGYRWMSLEDAQKVCRASKKAGKTGMDSAGRMQEPCRDLLPVRAKMRLLDRATVGLVELRTETDFYVFASYEEGLSFLGRDSKIDELRGEISNLRHNSQYVDESGRKWRFQRGMEAHGPICDLIRRFPGVLITKEDALTGAVIVGYSSVEAAFQDWARIANQLPLDREAGLKTFESDYLDGWQVISGLLFRRTTVLSQTDK